MSMKLNSILLVGFLGLGIVSQVQAASSGTLAISGNIAGTSCTITGDGGDITVPLGTVLKDSFVATGAPVAAYGFPLNLSGCTAKSTVAVRFNGTADTVNPDFLKLTNETDMAQNVAVGLFERDGTTPIKINQNSQATVTDDSGAAKLYYQVAYVATGTPGSVTTGPANAIASFTIVNP